MSTGSGGVSAAVLLLNAQYQVTSTVVLPPSAILVSGDTVKATVPQSLLPSSIASNAHPGLTREFYAFAAIAPGKSQSSIAGLAPEYTMLKLA